MIWSVVLVIAAVSLLFLLLQESETPLQAEDLHEDLLELHRAHRRAEWQAQVASASTTLSQEIEELEKLGASVQQDPLVASQFAERLLAMAEEHESCGEIEATERSYLRAVSLLEQAQTLPTQLAHLLPSVQTPELHFDLIEAYREIGLFYQRRERHEEAAHYFRRSLQVHETLFEGEAHDRVPMLLDLADSLAQLSDHDEAEASFLKAVELAKYFYEHIDDESDNAGARLKHMHQDLHGDIHDMWTDEEEREEALFLWMACLHNLGHFYTTQKRYDEALELLQRVVSLSERQCSSDEAFVAVAMHSLADLYTEKAEYEEAELLYLRAFELRERAMMHPDHHLRVSTLYALAKMYIRGGQLDDAKLTLLQAEDLAKTEHSEKDLLLDIQEQLTLLSV
ncbi:MAG TPA: hypothetical protein DCE42_03020 [Myxococcales bacterium]|nr:hypothetical protein [Deltaproteobacteria bacterium]HAA53697.1 hypothetical protein [Myxococcales bacterium]|tara:strand:- start:18366 stop:19556 length:1191 start_codon:yes stop_codon:yes gene_type:complete